MGGIVCGRLRIDVDGRTGNRLSPWTPRPASAVLPRRPDRVGPPEVLLDRAVELEQIRDALRRREPVEFHAPCGFGTSTLLQYVAAAAPGVGLPGPYAMLRVGGDSLGDLMVRLVSALFVWEPGVKPTSEECVQVLSQACGVVVLDEVLLEPAEVDYLRSVIPSCGILLAAPTAVLQQGGRSRVLAGLPKSAALQLVAGDLGRPLAKDELPAVDRLYTAVDGQPRHLRLAAALVREGTMTFEALAEEVRRGGSNALERRSLGVLSPDGRRVLAVLALAAGALLPVDLVATMSAVHNVRESLRDLHRRGLTEAGHDRYGLPVCKRDGYRQSLLGELEVGGAIRSLGDWLASRDPWDHDALSAADAGLAILGFAAEQRDWVSVVRLARLLEPILLIAHRWEACSHVLELGMHAASEVGNAVTQAYFAHQHGTLAAAQDHAEVARRSLERALALRERLGDAAGAEVTRSNLALVGAVPPPAPPFGPSAGAFWRSGRGKAVAVVTAILSFVGLFVLLADVFAGGSDGPTPAPTTASTPAAATSVGPTSVGPTDGTTSPSAERTSRSEPKTTSPRIVLTRIDITPTESTLVPEELQQLTAVGTYSDGSSQDVTGSVDWASTDSKVASVDDGGLVTAVGEGTVNITGTLAGEDDTVTVTVSVPAPVLTAIEVTPAEATVCIDNTQKLSADGTNSDGTTENVTSSVSWTSDDPAVAVVEDGGLVTAVGQGTTTIRAQLDDLEATATVTAEDCSPVE